MKQHKKFLIAFVLLLLYVGYTVTRGNAVWRIKSKYPTASVSFDPENTTEGCSGGLYRAMGFNYFSGKTPIGVTISEVKDPIDLSVFKGMVLGHVHFVNCRFTDISLLLTMYRPQVTWKDCDLTAVPTEQRRCLMYSKEFGIYQIDGGVMARDHPSGLPPNMGLQSYAFYP